MPDLVARGAPNPQTIRERINATEAAMQDAFAEISEGRYHNAQRRLNIGIRHAAAARDLLKAAPMVGPVSSQTYRRMVTAGKRSYRVVPDPPAPRGDAE